MTVYGEGPHVTAMTLLPLAVLALQNALVKRTGRALALAALAIAPVFLTNIPGSMALGVAVFCWICAQPRNRLRAAWLIAAAASALAYGAACFGVPPSSMFRVGANVGDMHRGFSSSLHYGPLPLVAVLGTFAAAGFVLARTRLPLIVRFAILFGALTGAMAATARSETFELLPQVGRLHLEFEMGACLLLGCATWALYTLFPRWIRPVLLVICLGPLFIQWGTYRERAHGATLYLIQSAMEGNCGVNLVDATAINDHGQISGTASVSAPGDANSASHAVLLTSQSTAPWMQGLTAVEASGHVVTAEPSRVTLIWETREVVLAHTSVERSVADGGWENVGAPTENGSRQLTFVDATVTPGLVYAYRLAVLDGGTVRYVGAISVRTPRHLSFAIQGFLPNPARAGDVTMSFSLAEPGDARIEIFDVSGRRSAVRDARGLPAGVQVTTLTEVKSLPSGLYFVRLSQAGRTRTSRLAIAR